MSEPLILDHFAAALAQGKRPPSEYPQRDQLVRLMSPDEYRKMSEPTPIQQYQTEPTQSPARVPDVRPSQHIESVVNQLKSALVEAYKLDGRRVKVVVVEKS